MIYQNTCMPLATLHLHIMVFWINIGWVIAIYLLLRTVHIISRLIEVLFKVLKVSHSVLNKETYVNKVSCDLKSLNLCFLPLYLLWILGLFALRLCVVTEQLFCCMCVYDAINSFLYLLEKHCHCVGRSCCNAILMIWISEQSTVLADNMLTIHWSVNCICSWKWFLLNG